MADPTDELEQPPAPVSPDTAGELVLAGRTLAPDAQVPVVVSDGSVQLVKRSDLDAALDQGWQVATSQQVQAFRDAEAYETAGAQVRAASEGTLRGLTVGLSDQAMSSLGVDMEGVRKRMDLNPIAAGAGEVVGTIAPLLATGGSSALAQGVARAGVLPRAITAAGGATQRGLRALVGGESVLARGGALAGAGAVEGSLYGVGQALSESAIQDAPLTAERVLEHVGMGAMFGGAAGGVLGSAAASVERTLIPKMREVFSPARVERFVEEHGLRQWAQGRGKAMFTKLRKDFGDDAPAIVGRTVKDEGLADLIAKDATWSEMHAATKERLGTAGRRIGQTMRAIDELQPTNTAASAAAMRIAAKADDEILSVLRKTGIADDVRLSTKLRGNFPALWIDEASVKAGLVEEAAGAGKRLSGAALQRAAEAKAKALALRQEYTPSFERLHGLRVRVDAYARGAAQGSPEQKAYQQLREVIEDEVTAAADAAAAASGGKVAQDYTAQKLRYKTLLWLDKAAESNAAGDLANRQFGLTDTIGAIGVSGPALVSLLAGDVSVLGSVMIAGASGALAGLANRYLRTQGQGLVARTAERVLQIVRADERAAKASTAAVRSFFARPTAAVALPFVALPAAESIAEGFDRRTKVLDRYAAAPDAMLRRSLGDTADSVPALHGELRAVTARAAAFLEGKRPQLRSRPSDAWGPLDERQRVSDSAMARFGRYYDATTNPRAAVQAFADGRLTREGVEALQAVYPRVHAQLVEQVQAELATKTPGSVSKDKLVQLSYLLRTPLHPALDPQLTAMCQAVHAASRKAAEQGLTPGQRRAPDTAGAQASASQQLQMARG